IRPERLEHGKACRFNLIHPFRAVHRSSRFVWIADRYSSFHKLMHRLPANRLPYIRSVLLVVVLPSPVHDGRNANKWKPQTNSEMAASPISQAGTERNAHFFAFSEGRDRPALGVPRPDEPCVPSTTASISSCVAFPCFAAHLPNLTRT